MAVVFYLVAVVALAALGLWVTRKSTRRSTPSDLRRADEAEAGPPFDPAKAQEAASTVFDETPR